MGVVTLKSTALTNRDAVPKVLTDPFIAGGVVSQAYGYVFTGAADSAASNYKLVSVPSNCRLSSLSMINGALGSGCVLDVAVWYPTTVPQGGGAFLAASLGGTLIGSSNFTTAIVGNTTNTTPSELVVTTNTLQGPNYQEMPLWQMLNLASDPETAFDIGFSVRIAVASAGYIGLKATYVF